MGAIEPQSESTEEFLAKATPDRPIVVINLLRYRGLAPDRGRPDDSPA